MAGNWYLGGMDQVRKTANAWTNDTLYCSLVSGSALAANVISWQNMNDFRGGGNNVMTGAKDVAMPAGRTAFFDTAADAYRFTWPAGKISLGTPTAGQDFCGVLIHGGLSDENSTRIWAYQRITGQTAGGAVEWGSASNTNEILTLNPLTVSGANTGRGFCEEILDATLSSWSGGTDVYHFSLVQSGVFNKDWKYVNDAVNGGMTFCTNCGWGESAVPTLAGFQRGSATYTGTGEYVFYPTVSGNIPDGLKWNGADLQTGETATGILGYVYDPVGTYESPIFMYNQISPSITLTTGQDVVWDSFDSGTRTLMRINMSGD